MINKKENYCVDCGGAQVNHKIAYVSILLNSIVDPYINWLSKIIPEKSIEWMEPHILRVLTFLKLGSIEHSLESDATYRAQVLWAEAKRRGIDMYEFRIFGKGREIFVSEYKGEKRCFDSLPRPKDYNPKGLEWMDDKNEMKKHFRKEGIPVARGDIACTLSGGLKIFESLDKPVITKPHIGSRSRHTTTHINTKEEFIKAYKKANQLSPWVLIEEELKGFVFRGTVIGGKLIAVLRREPPYVIGDGIHNIQELVEIENKNPLRDGPIFHKLNIDEEAYKELKNFGHTVDMVPAKGQVITLGQKTSRAVGGGITDVTESVHPDNKEMLEHIGRVLDDPLTGVDFIMDDVSISYKDQSKSGVIECNSAPFIDLHHYPLVGESRNVASALWDIIYPNSKI